MKKAISLVLVLVFAFAICVPAFAANETTGSTFLSYSVDPNYTVTISPTVTITAGTGQSSVSVGAGSLLDANKKLTFAITAATNYDGGFKLVNGLSASVLLDYTITAGVTDPVAKDAIFFEATAEEAYAGASITLNYETGTAVAAGTYTDLLTYTIATALAA